MAPAVDGVTTRRDNCHDLGASFAHHRWFPYTAFNHLLGARMPPKMVWLASVVRLAITPVFLGTLFL